MNALRVCFLALFLIASATPWPIQTNYRWTSNGLSVPSNFQAISQAAHLFSIKIVKTVAKEQPGNLICSPLSTYIALSMVASRAGGKTEAQLKDVLKTPVYTLSTLYATYFMIESLNNVENVVLKLAQKVFIQESFPVKFEINQVLRAYYLSDTELVDFRQAAKAANTINTWCKKTTNDRIDSIVEESDITPDTVLVLTNAVYFKGNWRNKFNSNYTTDRPFHIDANTVKNVSTMNRTGDYKLVHLPEYEATCIELPYADEEVSMVIVLPDKIDGLAALTDKHAEVIAKCNTRLAQANKWYIQLYLPKFKTESKFDLTNTLIETMGLSEPFSSTANFSGISDRDLHIDKVLQKAFIEVNEEGNDAPAVRDVLTPVTLIKYKVDKPFLYAIVKSYHDDIENTVTYVTLFVGRVIEPTV